jgi:hypothetical protein
MHTLWDFSTGDSIYDTVITNLRNLIQSSSIDNVFVSDTKKLGHDFNRQQLEDGLVITWDHFYLEIPTTLVKSITIKGQVSTLMNDHRTSYQVLNRGLTELTQNSTETVLELISSNSIYRGEEDKPVLEAFLKLQKQYAKSKNKDLFVWEQIVTSNPSLTRIRNTSIGTLLIDISSGLDLQEAVDKFGKIKDPANYKRPKAVFTQKMLETAEKELVNAGLLASLERRFAVVDDLSVNNLLYVDRNAIP